MHGRSQTDRWLFLAFVSVVILFALATIASQRIARTIESASRAITENAAPSILNLSIARSSLALEQLRLDDYLDAAGDGRPPSLEVIEAPWQRMRAALDAYRGVPPLPGEVPLAAPLTADLAAVTRLRDEVLALARSGRMGDAVAMEKQQLDDAMHVARDRLDRLIAYDASQAAQLGERIHAQHVRARATALLLDGLVAVITLAVAGLALRQTRLMRRRLETRNRELEARGLELEEFSGRMAHDVLSPLFTAGVGWELARKLYPHDERLARLAETSRAAIQRSRRLVEDLLAFSLAGAKPRGGSTELGPVFADVLANVEPEANDAKVSIHSGALPRAKVACSPGVLTSILLNLMRNAIKHMNSAQERQIELRGRILSERFVCEVRDTGPGIPFEEQRAIFEPYVRGTTQAAGMGLGLATVKRLVEGHGGEVGVRSAPGRGSTFWFALPLVGQEDTQAPLLQ